MSNGSSEGCGRPGTKDERVLYWVLPTVANYLCEWPKHEAARPGSPQWIHLHRSGSSRESGWRVRTLRFRCPRACSGIRLRTSNPTLVHPLLATGLLTLTLNRCFPGRVWADIVNTNSATQRHCSLISGTTRYANRRARKNLAVRVAQNHHCGGKQPPAR
jgi:hypothetical protein